MKQIYPIFRFERQTFFRGEKKNEDKTESMYKYKIKTVDCDWCRWLSRVSVLVAIHEFYTVYTLALGYALDNDSCSLNEIDIKYLVGGKFNWSLQKIP